ncbi:MAG: ribosomal L7Ae/L30e/S12e/Gadd45 family protein [Nitrososphaerales archaeon]
MVGKLKADEIEKFLAKIGKNSKYITGYKEVLKDIRGSKVLIYSSSLSREKLSKLKQICDTNSITHILYPNNSLALGKALQKPYRVSVVAIKSSGDIDINQFLRLKLKSVVGEGHMT